MRLKESVRKFKFEAVRKTAKTAKRRENHLKFRAASPYFQNRFLPPINDLFGDGYFARGRVIAAVVNEIAGFVH